MKQLIKYHSYIYVLLFLIVSNISASNTQDSTKIQLEKIVIEAKKIRYKDFSAANEFLKNHFDQFIKKGDSVSAVTLLIDRAEIFSHQANYNKSYDVLWRALILSDKLKNEALKSKIFQSIGRLYSFFHKKEEAFKYLENSLLINKKLIQVQKASNAILVNNHYNFSATYRDLKDFKKAKIHLDSCFYYYNESTSSLNINYLKFEQSFIHFSDRKYKSSLDVLFEIEPWFTQNEPSYLVLIYTQLGDTYSRLLQSQKAEEYYLKALDISANFNAHIDFTPLIYEKLSVLNLTLGNYKKAYENTYKAKNLDAIFFDSRSYNNRSLLEVKDTYLIEKQEQELNKREEELAKLKQDDRILLLQRVILFVILTSTLIIGILYLVFVKSKHKNEKQIQELELIKTNESLELRNKELAGFALQLAEKDEFLRELKSKLKVGSEKININEIKQISKSITISNERSWQEFRLRFTAVNEVFYNKLTTDFPKLTQRDQKICAFIKLNLSSKKMASLLGISVESVHTIRYRLRKKLNLSTDVNLEDFIANL